MLLDEVALIAGAAHFRHLVTPGGYTMSVAMINCGPLGWVSDRTGYGYHPADPATAAPWPTMPAAFLDLAARCRRSRLPLYRPDACLINRYLPGSKLGLHQGLHQSPCRLLRPGDQQRSPLERAN